LKGKKSNKGFFIIFVILSTYCLNSNIVQLTINNQFFRRILTPKVDIENVVGELTHFASRGGEWLVGVLRDFVLDNPTTTNFRFLKGIKGEERENKIGEILASLIKELHENSPPQYLRDLGYALRYFCLDSFTEERFKRIFTITKEISENKDILPSFVIPYINNEILKKSEEIHLLNEQEGKSLTLREIEENPEKTFVSIMDVDNLSLFNRAYGKSILDYVLDDIRRTAIVSLKEFDSFAYTNSGRDELWITLSGVDEKTKAEEILRLINQRVQNKKYAVIRLKPEINSFISSLSVGEFERLKQILIHRGIGISDGKYVKGEYFLILPISYRQRFIDKIDAENFLNSLFPELNNYLKQNGFDIKLEGDIFPFNTGFLPKVTVSIGACSFNSSDYDFVPKNNPENAYNIALRRANIALRKIKETREKNDVKIYEEGMGEYEDGRKIFSEGFLQVIEGFFQISNIPVGERDPLCPNLYDSSVLRDKIQELITQGKNGHLIWIEPRYYVKGKKEPLQFHIINELYGLDGGDLIIKVLSYLLSKNIPPYLRNSVLISRAPPDGLLLFIPEKAESSNKEVRTIIPQILDNIKLDFDSNSKILNVYFDTAIANTEGISQVGELFWRGEYTHYSQNGAEIYPTKLGNIIKIYTLQVENEIIKIQRKMQQDAFNEMSLIFKIEEFDEGP
jgi:GGDEF domain-containing protein